MDEAITRNLQLEAADDPITRGRQQETPNVKKENRRIFGSARLSMSALLLGIAWLMSLPGCRTVPTTPSSAGMSAQAAVPTTRAHRMARVRAERVFTDLLENMCPTPSGVGSKLTRPKGETASPVPSHGPTRRRVYNYCSTQSACADLPPRLVSQGFK